METKSLESTSHKLKRSHSSNTRSQSVRRTSIREKSQISRREAREEGRLRSQENSLEVGVASQVTTAPSSVTCSDTTVSSTASCHTSPSSSESCSFTPTSRTRREEDDAEQKDSCHPDLHVVVLEEDDDDSNEKEVVLPDLDPASISRISLRQVIKESSRPTRSTREGGGEGLNQRKEGVSSRLTSEDIDHYSSFHDGKKYGQKKKEEVDNDCHRTSSSSYRHDHLLHDSHQSYLDDSTTVTSDTCTMTTASSPRLKEKRSKNLVKVTNNGGSGVDFYTTSSSSSLKTSSGRHNVSPVASFVKTSDSSSISSAPVTSSSSSLKIMTKNVPIDDDNRKEKRIHDQLQQHQASEVNGKEDKHHQNNKKNNITSNPIGAVDSFAVPSSPSSCVSTTSVSQIPAKFSSKDSFPQTNILSCHAAKQSSLSTEHPSCSTETSKNSTSKTRSCSTNIDSSTCLARVMNHEEGHQQGTLKNDFPDNHRSRNNNISDRISKDTNLHNNRMNGSGIMLRNNLLQHQSHSKEDDGAKDKMIAKTKMMPASVSHFDESFASSIPESCQSSSSRESVKVEIHVTVNTAAPPVSSLVSSLESNGNIKNKTFMTSGMISGAKTMTTQATSPLVYPSVSSLPPAGTLADLKKHRSDQRRGSDRVSPSDPSSLPSLFPVNSDVSASSIHHHPSGKVSGSGNGSDLHQYLNHNLNNNNHVFHSSSSPSHSIQATCTLIDASMGSGVGSAVSSTPFIKDSSLPETATSSSHFIHGIPVPSSPSTTLKKFRGSEVVGGDSGDFSKQGCCTIS